MDIYCKHCGEPWDMAELHEVYVGGFNGTKRVPYGQAVELFKDLGCGAFQTGKTCSNAMVDPDRAEQAAVMQDLLEHPDEWSLFD